MINSRPERCFAEMQSIAIRRDHCACGSIVRKTILDIGASAPTNYTPMLLLAEVYDYVTDANGTLAWLTQRHPKAESVTVRRAGEIELSTPRKLSLSRNDAKDITHLILNLAKLRSAVAHFDVPHNCLGAVTGMID